MSGATLTVRSPGKINWCLRVLGRRRDGFHDIASLVSAVSLYDQLTFTRRFDPGVGLECDQAGVPADQSNLVLRAASLLAEASGHRGGAVCRLNKGVPVGGGMGGGSSNGAWALIGLNRLWGLKWPLERLAPLAAELGSDVSFFLWGGSGVMSGRGEHIRSVSLGWQGWIVLLLPGFSTSTAEVYRAWEPADQPPTLMDEILAGAAPARVDATTWMNACYNMLERPLLSVCPAMGRLLEAGSELAGRPIRVSGSGSTLFIAFDARDEAEAFAARAERELSVSTRVVQPIEQGQSQRFTEEPSAPEPGRSGVSRICG